MPGTDFDTQIKQLDATLRSVENVLDLDGMRGEIADLQEQVGAPDLWDDQANAQRVTGRLSTLQAELERATGLRQRLDDLGVLVELAQEESDPDTLSEAEAELARVHKAVEALEVR
ncbi:MAG TPA: PCRF domain-containing protein, partial [Nocardioidaceae bacterium]|nr:PCRF domain-containing protein [Nocardioidaceae bacterium]